MESYFQNLDKVFPIFILIFLIEKQRPLNVCYFHEEIGEGWRDEFEEYRGCLGTMNYEQVGYCMNAVIVTGFT